MSAAPNHQPHPNGDTPAARRPDDPTPRAPGRLVCVAAGAPDVGSTTVAVNLALALARVFPRVTLIDADPGPRSAAMLLPADDAADGPAPSATPGRTRCVSLGPRADQPLDLARVLAARVRDEQQRSPIVVLDIGALSTDSLALVLPAIDLTIVVSTPEAEGVVDAYAALKAVTTSAPSPADAGGGPVQHAVSPGGPPRLGLVVNSARTPRDAAAVQDRVTLAARRFLGVEVSRLGSVRADGAVSAALESRSPLLVSRPGAPAARDLVLIADRLHRAFLSGPVGA